ncbi:D-alanyl-D-alanine carboxypeptidase [Edwardsiella hoshinae]|uniref:D-alanyl-D-alanine carboxypeptidase n=2 Tax=Edwardsiella hoshinae TaxID=93378 RepID=A0A376DIF8_9GAMM|nr:M15 family metallopeptidase [Edwardsiella hoshinae]STC89916.1 D-alanyl-D-alanine carboxypeptidase [Edwardsiella hoshinae]
MITPAMLTGQCSDHLVALCGHHRLQAQAAEAFRAMQQRAQADGINLQPASTFRDFARQQTIWNDKFHGRRPLLDADSRPLQANQLAPGARCQAILHWSALPGASRHHWGCDLDVYDVDALPAEARLQLEPWEYHAGGYFYPLTRWLDTHMAEFDFYRPFTGRTPVGVAAEPWHLSYRPLAQQAETQLTPALLLAAWQDHEIAGRAWLTANMAMIFARYIYTQEGKQ